MTTPTPTTPTPIVMSDDERRVLAAYRRLKAESVKNKTQRTMVVAVNSVRATVMRCIPMG